FANIGDVLSLSPVLLEKYLGAAERIVVAADPAWRARLQSIGQKSEVRGQRSEPANERSDSAREIIAKFARRAFRQPVTQAEVERYLGLFKSANAEGESFEQSIKL